MYAFIFVLFPVFLLLINLPLNWKFLDIINLPVHTNFCSFFSDFLFVCLIWIASFFVKECKQMLHSRVQTPLSYMAAAAAMMIIFKKDPTQCLYLSWLLLSLLLLLWPLGHLRLASSAGRRASVVATSHRKARRLGGSASVFYICSSQFVEEKKETLRVIYLRTISAVRGGNRQKHLEQ